MASKKPGYGVHRITLVRTITVELMVMVEGDSRVLSALLKQGKQAQDGEW